MLQGHLRVAPRHTQDQSVQVGVRPLVGRDLIDHEPIDDLERGQIQVGWLVDQPAGDQVVEAAAEISQEMVLLLLVAGEDHVVAFFDLIDQLDDFRRRILEIIVNDHGDITTTVVQTGHHRIVFTIVPRQIKERDPGVLSGECLTDLGRVVARTGVVDQHHIQLVQVRKLLMQRVHQTSDG